MIDFSKKIFYNLSSVFFYVPVAQLDRARDF